MPNAITKTKKGHRRSSHSLGSPVGSPVIVQRKTALNISHAAFLRVVKKKILKKKIQEAAEKTDEEKKGEKRDSNAESVKQEANNEPVKSPEEEEKEMKMRVVTLESKLEKLNDQKHQLFVLLKQVLLEDEKKKQAELAERQRVEAIARQEKARLEALMRANVPPPSQSQPGAVPLPSISENTPQIYPPNPHHSPMASQVSPWQNNTWSSHNSWSYNKSYTSYPSQNTYYSSPSHYAQTSPARQYPPPSPSGTMPSNRSTLTTSGGSLPYTPSKEGRPIPLSPSASSSSIPQSSSSRTPQPAPTTTSASTSSISANSSSKATPMVASSQIPPGRSTLFASYPKTGFSQVPPSPSDLNSSPSSYQNQLMAGSIPQQVPGMSPLILNPQILQNHYLRNSHSGISQNYSTGYAPRMIGSPNMSITSPPSSRTNTNPSTQPSQHSRNPSHLNPSLWQKKW